MVLGLGDGAGGEEGGGVGVGGGWELQQRRVDGSKKRMRRYPGRVNVCYSGGFRH